MSFGDRYRSSSGGAPQACLTRSLEALPGLHKDRVVRIAKINSATTSNGARVSPILPPPSGQSGQQTTTAEYGECGCSCAGCASDALWTTAPRKVARAWAVIQGGFASNCERARTHVPSIMATMSGDLLACSLWQAPAFRANELGQKWLASAGRAA